jgi:serine/threonine-protein kinase RsbW
MTALQHHLETSFPASRAYCSEVRALLESNLAILAPPPSKDLLHNIILATDELFTNTVKHAYQEDDTKVVALEIRVTATQIAIEIRHKGTPFDPSSYTPFDPEATLEQRRTGGMGVFIMEHLADHVAFDSTDAGEHRAILQFNRLNTSN